MPVLDIVPPSRHVLMDQPLTLYKLRVLGGTHTQDELFLLTKEELQQHIADNFLTVPTNLRNRRQIEKWLLMIGRGNEKTYYRNNEFIFWRDLSREMPGKIAKIGTGNSTPPEMQPRPGETLQEFALRMMELADRETLAKEQKAMKSQGVNGNEPDSQGSDPTINAINGNKDLFPKQSYNEGTKSYIPVAFETFNLEQLKQYAEDNEINIEGCKTKAQYVSRLRGNDAAITMDGI